MQKKLFDAFSNLYPVSKTLRFRLKPQGNTERFVQENGLIQKDEKKAEAYKSMKATLDAYHKEYIERVMECVAKAYEEQKATEGDKSGGERKKGFGPADLAAVRDAYEALKKERSGDAGQKKKVQEAYKAACEKLRKTLCGSAFLPEEIKFLTSASLLKDEAKAKPEESLPTLEAWVRGYNKAHPDEKPLPYDTVFKKFSVYFSSYHETRGNMYTDEEKATGIAYRLVNENLPKFLDNIRLFEQAAPLLGGMMEESAAIQEERESLEQEKLAGWFTLDGFTRCLTQSGIDKYNALLGGYTAEEKKVRGLNEFINLHNQKAQKKDRLPLFRPLYKQILSDRDAISFLPRAFATADEMYDAITSYYGAHILDHENRSGSEPANIFDALDQLFAKAAKDESAWEKIYISQAGLSDVSQKLCGRYGVIREALEYEYAHVIDPRYEEKLAKAKTEGQREKLEKSLEAFAKAPYFSAALLNRALRDYSASLDEPLAEDALNVMNYPVRALHPVKENSKGERKAYAASAWLNEAYCPVKGELCTKHEDGYRPGKENIEHLKIFLDSLLEFIRALRPFAMRRKDEALYERDPGFYQAFSPMWDELSVFSRLYDAVRNFASQKPYSEEKFKLTFDYPTLADGWDENKVGDNGCVLLKKSGRYYLAITPKGKKMDYESLPEASGQETHYEKMVYKYFPGPTKMIPKCTVTTKECKKHFDSGKAESYSLSEKSKKGSFSAPFAVEREIYDLYFSKETGKPKFTGEYLKATGDDEGYKKATRLWIAFCIRFLKAYASTAIYDFSSLKAPEAYESVSEFYNEVNKLTYKVEFRRVPARAIDALVEKGGLYLFEISNRDIGRETGTPNLHTLYWNALFSPQNIHSPRIKLNGQAELFYRRASVSEPTVHKKGDLLVSRVMTDGKTMPEHVYQKVCGILAPNYNKNGSMKKEEADAETLACLEKARSRCAQYDIIKDRRYTHDTFMLHVPLTFNFDAEGTSPRQMNEKLLELAANSDDVRIIGIDRGERHLLYVSVIDKQGNILEQETLNTVGGVDYHSKLDAREKERAHAKESWQAIGKIAELKEGYLSHAIHRLTELMARHNAIIVLEDLNVGFKRGRFKVEKQVYQKFEKALITKLNYLCFKGCGDEEPGGVLNAYQLTTPFESFSRMGKQNGVLFYVPAWNTSKIDPVTGFVDTLKPRYANREDAHSFFSRFERIGWNSQDSSFEFSFVDTGTGKSWTITTGSMERYVFDVKANNNKGAVKKVNVTAELQKSLQEAGIDWRRGDIRDALCSSENAALLKSVMWCLKVVLSMRYSSADDGRDFILSPVKMPDGRVFCSENAPDSLPKDADANGAYNIARKGLLLLERVKAGLKDAAIIRNADWLDFTQQDHVVLAQQEKY